jgi:hypothetical protein
MIGKSFHCSLKDATTCRMANLKYLKKTLIIA